MENNLAALTTVFTEFYYWLTVPLMFLIHVGFCMYEVGASRRRNHMHTLMKNSMIIPLVTVTFFYFGWWLYWAVPNGPFITGGLETATAAANTPFLLHPTPEQLHRRGVGRFPARLWHHWEAPLFPVQAQSVDPGKFLPGRW